MLTPEQYENIIAALQLEAINFDGDKKFDPIAKLIKRLAYEIPVCKIYHAEGKRDFLLVGYQNTKGDIILREPKKSIEEIEIQYPKLYLPGFYTYPKLIGENIENATPFSLPVISTNEIDEVVTSQYSIGYIKNEKIIYWEQYEK